jgi:hypothetical protein
MDLGRRASFLLPLSLVGCRKTRSPEAVSDAFVDRYYIEKDHAKALEITVDSASARVSSEQRLLAQSGVYPGPQPRVFYNRLNAKPQGGDTELLYALTIDASGVKIHKEVRVNVVQRGDEFKVARFDERDVVR